MCMDTKSSLVEVLLSKKLPPSPTMIINKIPVSEIEQQSDLDFMGSMKMDLECMGRTEIGFYEYKKIVEKNRGK